MKSSCDKCGGRFSALKEYSLFSSTTTLCRPCAIAEGWVKAAMAYMKDSGYLPENPTK